MITRVIRRIQRTLLGTRERTRSTRALVHQLEEQLRTEQERVSQLEADLDELRHDRLRVAELLDLAEQSFTPDEAPRR